MGMAVDVSECILTTIYFLFYGIFLVVLLHFFNFLLHILKGGYCAEA